MSYSKLSSQDVEFHDKNRLDNNARTWDTMNRRYNSVEKFTEMHLSEQQETQQPDGTLIHRKSEERLLVYQETSPAPTLLAPPGRPSSAAAFSPNSSQPAASDQLSPRTIVPQIIQSSPGSQYSPNNGHPLTVGPIKTTIPQHYQQQQQQQSPVGGIQSSSPQQQQHLYPVKQQQPQYTMQQQQPPYTVLFQPSGSDSRQHYVQHYQQQRPSPISSQQQQQQRPQYYRTVGSPQQQQQQPQQYALPPSQPSRPVIYTPVQAGSNIPPQSSGYRSSPSRMSNGPSTLPSNRPYSRQTAGGGVVGGGGSSQQSGGYPLRSNVSQGAASQQHQNNYDKMTDVYSDDTVRFVGALQSFCDDYVPPIVWIILAVLQIVVGISSIIIGAFNFNWCFAEPKIPMYLIFSGLLLIVNGSVRLCMRIPASTSTAITRDGRRVKHENSSVGAFCRYAIEGAILFFIIVVLILGCIWVYGARYVQFERYRFERNYCNHTVYWFAWWSVTGHLVVFSLAIIVVITVLVFGAMATK